MKVAIHQPQYLAWPGYFAKILFVDVFILYDLAQYQKGAIINRNKLLFDKKEEFLTIPLQAGHSQDKIKDKKATHDKWESKHIRKMEANYRKCVFYPEVLAIFEKTFDNKTDSLSEINFTNIRCICEYLGIKTPLVLSSQLDINENADPTQKNIDMVQKVSGTEYISGTGSKNYLQENMFPSNRISLRYFQFMPSEYPQLGAAGHVPGLSIIDMIANIPKEDVILHLKKGWVEV